VAIFEGTYTDNKATGEFRETEFGKFFEYRISEGNAPLQGKWGIENGFKHEVAMCDGSVRFANVKKTVAYICTDVDYTDDGIEIPLIEKWKIKHIWMK
jgi:hypothetical protein